MSWRKTAGLAEGDDGQVGYVQRPHGQGQRIVDDGLGRQTARAGDTDESSCLPEENLVDKHKKIIEIIKGIAEGRYHKEIIDLTGSDTDPTLRAIAEAIRLMMVKIEAREKHLEMLNEQVREANLQARRNLIATVSTMAKALAARDAYTEGHAERVSQYSKLLAIEMGLSEEDIERVQLAGLLHDIGKIGFPDYLFLPHESNTSKEIIREIKQHPATGAAILKDLDFLGSALSYIRSHHERPDGRGYPDGLKDSDIPLGAKIISVADAFDAITTDRPYQQSRSFEEALRVLEKGAGTKWDRGCVDAFKSALPKIPRPAVKAVREALLSYNDMQREIVLESGPAGGARLRWLKPGIDFKRYNSLMLDPVIFFFASDSNYKGMDPQELKALGDLFHRRLRESLKKHFAMATSPGPNVARIRFAITDLRQHLPDRESSAGLEIGMVQSWVSSGATCAELIVFDSLTGSPIAAAKDDRKYGLKERFTQWGSAEDSFTYWGERLSLFMEQARQR